MKQPSYKRKLLFLLLSVVLGSITVILLLYANSNYIEYKKISQNISWASSSPRPEKFKGNSEFSEALRFKDAQDGSAQNVARARELAKDLGLPENFVAQNPWAAEQERIARQLEKSSTVAAFLEEDIATWDAIHANPSLAKREASNFFIKAVVSGIIGIFTFLIACFSFYTTYHEAVKVIRQVIVCATTTPIRRFGLLLLGLACASLAFSIICWNLFVLGAILLIIGLILASGIAERLAKWIRYGS